MHSAPCLWGRMIIFQHKEKKKQTKNKNKNKNKKQKQKNKKNKNKQTNEQTKTKKKSRVVTILLTKKWIFAYIKNTKSLNSQFSRACSYHDVILVSYIKSWYLFWYQWKEGVHTYRPTLVVNLGLDDLHYW